MEPCIFCDIAAKKAPAEILYQDETCFVIKDIHPLAPIHFLVIPFRHIDTFNDLDQDDVPLIGHLLLIGKQMAGLLGVAQNGYRLAINVGRGGGQTEFHLHVHLLAGARMDESLLARGLA